MSGVPAVVVQAMLEGVNRESDALDWKNPELIQQRELLAPRIAAIADRPRVDGPDHLIVLAHGLAGTADDLGYLKRAILREQVAGTEALVLTAACNEGETRDGVAAGGWRLANEVVDAVEGAGSVRRLSLVGNSLGGLYARYAAALLFHPPSGGVCGVAAESFVTTATPHLGIRSFTYLPLPSELHGLGELLVGATGRDLFLAAPAPARPLLLQMALDADFLDPLAAFARRRAYANLEGDFLVPFGTAAFAVAAEGGWGILERGPASRFQAHAAPLVIPGCPHAACELTVPAGPRPRHPAAFPSLEHAMAAGLDACGWSKVGVSFGAGLPLAHNKIVALEGGGLLRAPLLWMWEDGRAIMDSLARYLANPP